MPVLLGIVPFGVITGVAMVASGIPRDRAMIAAALAAGLAVALAHDLPLRLNIVLAAATGIAAGLVYERKKA